MRISIKRCILIVVICMHFFSLWILFVSLKFITTVWWWTLLGLFSSVWSHDVDYFSSSLLWRIHLSIFFNAALMVMDSLINYAYPEWSLFLFNPEESPCWVQKSRLVVIFFQNFKYIFHTFLFFRLSPGTSGVRLIHFNVRRYSFLENFNTFLYTQLLKLNYTMLLKNYFWWCLFQVLNDFHTRKPMCLPRLGKSFRMTPLNRFAMP